MIRKIVAYIGIAALAIFVVIANVKYHKTIQPLDNTTAKGLITEVICNSEDKCAATLYWLDTKKTELINIKKGDYDVADFYVVNIKLTTFQRLGITPDALPNLHRFNNAKFYMQNVGGMNSFICMVLFFVGFFKGMDVFANFLGRRQD